MQEMTQMVLILTQSAWDATASGTLTTCINKPHTHNEHNYLRRETAHKKDKATPDILG